METFDKKDLNEHQKEKFEGYERNSVARYLARYENILKDLPRGKKIKVLDMGGGSGNFALALDRYFKENGNDAEVSLLDITRYSTWEQYADVINIIEGSVFEAGKYFGQNYFDLIFLNGVCHHLVQTSWLKTIKGISALLVSIRSLLKENSGILCISEIYYGCSWLGEISSFIIYFLSSIKVPLIAKSLRKIGSKSSGVGVCFLSISRWRKLLTETGYKIELMEDPKKGVKHLPLTEQFFYFVCR
ncbi:MAG: class I SAM-dependent methyltransferase [Synergistaceae bacterium]|jgi:SAM-dependent methyltransferase|nr:class I SAM-dependent methyltransferase [Synergistaceae bacterium]